EQWHVCCRVFSPPVAGVGAGERFLGHPAWPPPAENDRAGVCPLAQCKRCPATNTPSSLIERIDDDGDTGLLRHWLYSRMRNVGRDNAVFGSQAVMALWAA